MTYSCSLEFECPDGNHDCDLGGDDSSDEGRSPEYYIIHSEAINNSEITRVDYGSATTEQLNRVERSWQAYCAYVRKDPQETLSSLSIGDLSSYFSWKLDRRRGHDGRRLRRTRLKSSLQTLWKVFRLVFERTMGAKVDAQLNRQMHQTLRVLAQDHKLTDKKRPKAPLDLEDVRLMLITNLVSTEITYKIGRYRIQNALFAQGAFFTANRPTALRSLQYRHICITLLRDPAGGPHRILLEFTFEFTKSYLGAKDGNTFPIPEIIFDPSLVRSPHILLLGLVFVDKAFRASSLKQPGDLNRLSIPTGRNSLELPLKPEMADVYVFRQAKQGASGWLISGDSQIQAATTNAQFRRIGQVAGLLLPTVPYGFRYGSGTAFDRSGNISDSLRNLMMQHQDTRVFLNHYLSGCVTVDTAAVDRELEPQDGIMNAACRMSRWVDPSRPWKLTPQQSADVNADSRIQRLLRLRQEAREKGITQGELIHMSRRIANEKQRIRAERLTAIRATWDAEQAVKTIENQLVGSDFTTDMRTKLSQSTQERTREHEDLISAIMSLPGATVEEESTRRTTAILAVMKYCAVEEVCKRSLAQSERRSLATTRSSSAEGKCLLEIRRALYLERRPTNCFVCVGNEALPLTRRVARFHSPGDLSKHFRRSHLAHIGADDTFACVLCGVTLVGRMHVQNHALRIHGTVS